MRILNDEELNTIPLGEDCLECGKSIAKAQHQQDLKDFIEWLEERMWFEDSRTAGIRGSSSKFYDDFKSLKQLVES